MKLSFLDNIPDWLKWVLFLPTALIAFTLAYPIIIIGNKILSFGEFEGILGQILLWRLAGGWSGFVFVWVGAKVAPKGQPIAATLFGAIGACSTFFERTRESDQVYYDG